MRYVCFVLSTSPSLVFFTTSQPCTQDLELTEYYQIIGRRIRSGAKSPPPTAESTPAATPTTAAADSAASTKTVWDLVSNIEGRGEFIVCHCQHSQYQRPDLTCMSYAVVLQYQMMIIQLLFFSLST